MTTSIGAFHRWRGFRVWQGNGDGVSQPTGVGEGDVWLVYNPADTGAVAPADSISAPLADGAMSNVPSIAGTLTGQFDAMIFNAGSSSFILPASAGVAISAPILSIAETAAPRPQGTLQVGGGEGEVSLVYTGTVVSAGLISASHADGTMSGVLTTAGTLTGLFDGAIFNAGSSPSIALPFAGAVSRLPVVGTAAAQQQDHLVLAGGDVSLVYDATVTGAVAPTGTISVAPSQGTVSGVLTIAGLLTSQASGTMTSAAASAVIAPAGLVVTHAVPILSFADTVVAQPQGHLMFASS
jgi:hypothetical protein